MTTTTEAPAVLSLKIDRKYLPRFGPRYYGKLVDRDGATVSAARGRPTFRDAQADMMRYFERRAQADGNIAIATPFNAGGAYRRLRAERIIAQIKRGGSAAKADLRFAMGWIAASARLYNGRHWQRSNIAAEFGKSLVTLIRLADAFRAMGS